MRTSTGFGRDFCFFFHMYSDSLVAIFSHETIFLSLSFGEKYSRTKGQRHGTKTTNRALIKLKASDPRSISRANETIENTVRSLDVAIYP